MAVHPFELSLGKLYTYFPYCSASPFEMELLLFMKKATSTIPASVIGTALF